MKKFIFSLSLLSLLSACTPPLTRDQQLQIHHAHCLDYGYQVGTLAFSECMMRQEGRAEKRALQMRKWDAFEQSSWIERERYRQEELNRESSLRK